MEIGTHRIVHHNVTAHPTAEWTLSQFREAPPGDHGYRYVIHDREWIYSKDWTRMWRAWAFGLRTPVRSPKANGYCEPLVRTARREWLDYLIPLAENHLKRTLIEWVRHDL
jgi:hypothetical protein